MAPGPNDNGLPRGLIIELLTPLDSSGRLHRDSLLRLVSHLKSFADGLLLFGPESGLGPDLKAEIRAETLTLVAREVDLPLFAFITCPTKTQTVECLDSLLETGAGERLVIVDAPLLVRSNRGLPDWLAWLADHSGRPLVLYNHPRLMTRVAGQTKRRNIRTSVLKKAAQEIDALRGLIFQGSFKRLINYHQAVRSRTGFKIYDADERRFLDRPSSAGVVSPGANLLPAAWSQVVHSALFLKRPSRMADLLACARAVRRLGRLNQRHSPAWLTSGLKEVGILDGSLPTSQAGPDRERVSRLLAGLGLERWGLRLKPQAGV